MQTPTRPEPTTQMSFEHILGWFGKFTPQFKFRLMALRREISFSAFDSLMTESMKLYRDFIYDLSQEPKGAARARRVFELMDSEGNANPVVNVSCGAGCAACCTSFPKQVTSDEADLLAELVISGKAEIDMQKLKAEAKNGSGRCAFLDADNRCQVYAMRPAVCRKYHVTSPKEACSDDSLSVTPRIDLVPELIASAAMSLPDNEIGFMNEMLDKRINRPVQFEAALPDLDIES